MVRYFYAWTPLGIVFGTVILLSIPYLAVIALMLIALVLLAALAWVIVSATLTVSGAISRRWHSRYDAIRPLAGARQVDPHPHAYAAWRGIDYPTPQFVRSGDATASRKEGVS